MMNILVEHAPSGDRSPASELDHKLGGTALLEFQGMRDLPAPDAPLTPVEQTDFNGIVQRLGIIDSGGKVVIAEFDS